MIDAEKLLGLPEPYADAGRAIAAYVEALESYAKLYNQLADVSADIHVLDEYIGGVAGDDILEWIVRMTAEEGLGDEPPAHIDDSDFDDDFDDDDAGSNMMEIDEAQALREQKENYHTYFQKKLNAAETVVAKHRLASRHELRKALLERRKAGEAGAKSVGYEALRLALAPCLEQQRKMVAFITKNKVSFEAISKTLVGQMVDESEG